MRKQRSVSFVIRLLSTASFGAAQQWVVTRTKADIEAEVRATQVSVSLEKTSIVAGEPLVLSVTIRNEGDTDKLRCMDKTCLTWTVRSAGGDAVSAWQPVLAGDIAVPAARLAPGAATSFSVVAPDIARIATPGAYEISVQYVDMAWDQAGADAEARSFTVLPRDEAALARRVKELSDAAAFPASPTAELAVEALAAIRYPVPEATLCAAMARHQISAKYLVPRLEASGDADAVACLVAQLGKGGLDVAIIGPALGRMAKKERDPVLRSDMENAMTDVCARATPDTPWLKGACVKP
jgi:hypothetical protein